MLPLNHCRRIFDLYKFVLLVVQEVKGEIVAQRVVGKQDPFEVIVLVHE